MGALVTGVQTCALPIAVVAQSRSDSSALRKRRTRAFPVALSGHRPDIVAIMARTFSGAITAVLGPTNTGKTHGRKSVVLGESVSVRVDLGGRRSIKKKEQKNCQLGSIIVIPISS